MYKPGRRSILHFIEKTHGFIPTIYQAYLKEGEALFPKLRTHVNAILRDELSLEDAQKIITEHGEEFLLGIIQMASPTSGASSVKKSEQLGLLKKMMEAGDLRGQIPEKWKNKIETFLLAQGAWELKVGEVVDSDGKIKALLNEFRVPDETPKLEEKELVQVLTDYLQGRTPEGREKVKKILYQYAGQNDTLREKVDRIQDNNYTALLLLEQLFSDKDNLYKMLADALNKIPGIADKRTLGDDIRAFVKLLQSAWNPKKTTSEEKRLLGLASILKPYEADEIEDKILSRMDLDEGLKEAVRKVLTKSSVLSKREIISEILSAPIGLIKTEKAKYNYQDAGTITVGLRAVKGPTYGCWALSAGVCTVDEQLWKDPNFKLLAISTSDLTQTGTIEPPRLSTEQMKQVVGYIHVYETVINGKKYITLPGINPSAEFMGTVDSKKLYEGIMQKVIEFAKAGDYHGVYIPTESNIHSNRSDFQKAIQKAGYSIKQIPTVNWNTKPSPYPFKEVYVVWENN